jgi:hypothetical protein
MEATFKPFFVQDAEHRAIAATTGLACSIGREMAERWPHAIGRIRIALSGGLGAPRARGATGEAFLLGLSGLTGRGSDPRKVAAIFGLNARMMAIRVNGRTLVAFTPDRDIRFGADFDGQLAGRVRAGAWSPGGDLLGIVERVLSSAPSSDPGSAVAGHADAPAEARVNALA